MITLRLGLLISCVASSMTAQSAAGISPAWDVRTMLKQLVDQTQTLANAVDQLKIKEWVDNGASASYQRQQEVVRTQTGYLRTVTSRLADDPEKLSLALDAYFRLQSLETYTLSLAEGAAKYQDGRISRQLVDLVARNSELGSKLRQYVMDLSVTKEQEYNVVEKEAQRCQTILNQPPPLSRSVTKGKK